MNKYIPNIVKKKIHEYAIDCFSQCRSMLPITKKERVVIYATKDLIIHDKNQDDIKWIHVTDVEKFYKLGLF